MEWTELLLKDVVVELVKALAWPAVVLAGLFMFRTGLRRITEALADRIPKMKRAAAGKDGLEAEFETDAAKLPDMGVKPVETAKPGEVEADRT